ncbi:MAG TPA: hypothetical protein VI589_15755 [Vicinamibacteria bacterium]
MRALATLLLLSGLAAPVLAQDQGSFALDAMTTPGRHFGAGYYVTDRFSLRPSLGFGYSDQFGTTFNLGTDLRFELLPGSRFSPYLAGGINYMRSPYLVADNGGSVPTARPGDPSSIPTASSNVTRYGAGVGLRTRLKYGISLIGEGRLMNSAIRDGYGAGYYGQQVVQSGAHFEAALGLSYVFN